MISLASVTKKFGTRTAVRELSFNAEEGEVIGFLGPNGAGKTTTMRLLLGYLQPSEGFILINDQNPILHRISVLKTIGYLPENNPLPEEMNVEEYLYFIAEVKHAGSVVQIAEQVDLQDRLQSKISELSRGYRQRVGLAAALIGNPDILILDEPTSGLDPIEQERIRKLINSLSKKKIIIFSTHMLSEVEDIATRLIIINKGSIVYDGDKPKARGGVEKLFRKVIKET